MSLGCSHREPRFSTTFGLHARPTSSIRQLWCAGPQVEHHERVGKDYLCGSHVDVGLGRPVGGSARRVRSRLSSERRAVVARTEIPDETDETVNPRWRSGSRNARPAVRRPGQTGSGRRRTRSGTPATHTPSDRGNTYLSSGHRNGYANEIGERALQLTNDARWSFRKEALGSSDRRRSTKSEKCGYSFASRSASMKCSFPQCARPLNSIKEESTSLRYRQ